MTLGVQIILSLLIGFLTWHIISANFKSPKIASVIMKPFSIPKVAKKCKKEPDFDIFEIKLNVLDLCISMDSFSQGQPIQIV